MLIRKGLIAFLLFGFVTVHAQLDLNSVRNAKNYVNNKVSTFIIEVKALSDRSNVKNYEPIKPKLEAVTIDKPLTYDELFKILQPKFNKTLINFSGPFSKVDENSIISKSPEEGAKQLIESAYAILKDKYPNETEEILSQKDGLTTTVTNYFKKNLKVGETTDTFDTDPIEISKTNDEDENIVRKEEADAQRSGFFDGFNGWILISYILLLVFFFYLFRLVMSALDRVEKRKREIENLRESIEFLGGKSGSSGFTASDIDRKIKSSDKIADLENEIRALKDKLNQMNSGLSSTNENTIQSRPVEIAPANNDVFYMSSPNNNYFPNTAKSSSKDNTVYIFYLTPSKNEAHYEVHTTGASAVEIAKRRENYIKPACDEENMPTLSTKSIITKKRGLAKLDGDKWVILSKAVVRYE